MKPRDLLAIFGAFWLLLITAGALKLVEFRVYVGEAPVPQHFCETHP